jgi:hypothetical protein
MIRFGPKHRYEPAEYLGSNYWQLERHLRCWGLYIGKYFIQLTGWSQIPNDESKSDNSGRHNASHPDPDQ